jgi:hypothetical protein
LEQISRTGCREYVRQKFDIREMALEYVNSYAMVQQRRRLFAVPAEIAAGSSSNLLTGETNGSRHLDESSLIS